MRVIEDSPRGGGGGRVVRTRVAFRFVRRRRRRERKRHVRHCSRSLNARNRKFKRVDGKRVERTNDGAKMQSRDDEVGCWKVDRGLISYLNVGTKLN